MTRRIESAQVLVRHVTGKQNVVGARRPLSVGEQALREPTLWPGNDELRPQIRRAQQLIKGAHEGNQVLAGLNRADKQDKIVLDPEPAPNCPSLQFVLRAKRSSWCEWHGRDFCRLDAQVCGG